MGEYSGCVYEEDDAGRFIDMRRYMNSVQHPICSRPMSTPIEDRIRSIDTTAEQSRSTAVLLPVCRVQSARIVSDGALAEKKLNRTHAVSDFIGKYVDGEPTVGIHPAALYGYENLTREELAILMMLCDLGSTTSLDKLVSVALNAFLRPNERDTTIAMIKALADDGYIEMLQSQVSLTDKAKDSVRWAHSSAGTMEWVSEDDCILELVERLAAVNATENQTHVLKAALELVFLCRNGPKGCNRWMNTMDIPLVRHLHDKGSFLKALFIEAMYTKLESSKRSDSSRDLYDEDECDTYELAPQ